MKERFAVLDGLRGGAAFAVLAFHIVQQRDPLALPFATLAVDFFYVLSGFVVAYAYETHLRSGILSLGSFTTLRIKRLYPLIFLGTVMGIALALFAAWQGRSVTYEQVYMAAILGLLLLPSFVFPQWSTAYPFNMASWSLTFEAFVNGVYAVLAPILSNARLVIVLVASAALLAHVSWMNDGIAGGNNQAGFFYGFGRVMFPFFAGVMIYRVRPRQVASSTLGMALMSVLFVMLFVDAVLIVDLDYDFLSSIVFVGLFFPAVVYAGAAVTVGPGAARLCFIAGELSYPIYILQGPVLRVGHELMERLSIPPEQHLLFGLAEAAVVVLVSVLAVRLYDRPLQRRFRATKTAPAPTPESARLQAPAAPATLPAL